MELTAHEAALVRLLRDAHLASDRDLPQLFDDYADALGVSPLVVYLSDLQERVLIPFFGTRGSGPAAHLDSLSIDATVAGRAFQHVEILTQTIEDGSGQQKIWLPLLDGIERLGLLSVVTPSPTALEEHAGALRDRLLAFASLAAELIMTKTQYGDTLVRARRTSTMGLAAEKQWSLLPPSTFADQRITICGGLEPAYAVGGDTFDYAVNGHRAHLAIFDAMGHGLRSAQLAALAVTAYRNARRNNTSLARTVELVDDAVAGAFDGDAFLTGQLAELDTDSGALTWVNAGHPSPLLLRAGRLVKELDTEPMLPIGLGFLAAQSEHQEGQEVLQPDDVVVFYSDGVIEARSPTGDFFGTDRLIDLVTTHLAAELPMPETTRRVIHSLLEHQQAHLDDDASLLFVHFQPADQNALLP